MIFRENRIIVYLINKNLLFRSFDWDRDCLVDDIYRNKYVFTLLLILLYRYKSLMRKILIIIKKYKYCRARFLYNTLYNNT